MDLLLKITTKPIEYNIRTEQATLSTPLTPNIERRQISDPAKVNMKTTDAKVDMDFRKTYESMGMKNVGTVMAEEGSKGMRAASNATAESVKMGDSLLNIQRGTTITEYVRNKNLSNVSITGQLALGEIEAPEMSVQPGNVEIDVTNTQLKNEWNIEKSKMEFVPGKYHMEITQFPEVKVEYVGGYNYVPPSADPDYEPIEE